MGQNRDDGWAEAARRCRLPADEIRMAKELGFQPRSLIGSIPAPSQQWKAPVGDWVRSLYEKRFGRRRERKQAPSAPPPRPAVIEFGNPEDPWPDRPEIPDLPGWDPFDPGFATDEMGGFPGGGHCGPPSDEETAETNALSLRRQRLFRWAAQAIAVALSELPEIQNVAAFGAAAQPLPLVVPRFSAYRRWRIEVLHECADLDLAVWSSALDRLPALRQAINRALSIVHDTPYGGVAHHQADVHIFAAAGGEYRGRRCIFKDCPKPGKRECFAPGCGAQPFLQQFRDYYFNPSQFAAEPKVILFDRAAGFLVRPPRIETPPRRQQARDFPVDDFDCPF